MTLTLAREGQAQQGETKETLGQRIARLLKDQGRRQCDLAQACQVDVTCVNKWVKGVAHPRWTLLPTVASYFGLRLAELVDDLADSKEAA